MRANTPAVVSQGRCAVWEEPIGPAGVRLRERYVIDPPEGHVRLRLRAAGLNHLDLWLVTGAQRAQPPRVISADGAGVVEASASPDWQPGDEAMIYPVAACGRCAQCRAGQQVYCAQFAVLGEQCDGAACEAIQVPARNLCRKPQRLGWSEAAAMPLAYLTAWRMLTTRARLRPGETLLVVGGAGGIGTAAVLIGLHLGATVVVTSRTEEKRGMLRKLGAAHAFPSEDFARPVLDITDGLGADVVVDHVGAATFEESMRSAARGGRVVTCGATVGLLAQLNLPRVFVRHLSVLGSTTGNANEFRELVAAADAGLTPLVAAEYPLAEVQAALAAMERGHQVGKVVLTCSS
jgi:NADPH:quinone reductase-like Zn-dependent oxidoreductase